VACGLVVIGYLGEFRFGMYGAGEQFSGARAVAKSLRKKAGNRSVRIGASMAAEPILSYYRMRYGQMNWQPIERQVFTGSYDYYVLTPADAYLIERRHLRVTYRDAGLTLAE
jgi:flavoprotein